MASVESEPADQVNLQRIPDVDGTHPNVQDGHSQRSAMLPPLWVSHALIVGNREIS
ncbi:hypothetical protein TG4357_02932 [Thalassovita gelatinovora]|uniref:Uncharacterized protein n=1 Tax=Thalassovita gelatinovora TaxID=53501 RepID=A0A0N7LVU9_THAGE|nr:hypothetical protein TG4357_02932 [Thalassovita gelatinovora]SEP76549.1 hypothetical protein SAMN04488043_101328 [Thalassovita gelatinovora]